MTDLTRCWAPASMNRTTLATGGPPQMPAPQFVAVAGGGPRPIIDVTIMGNTSTYIPSGPNQFYSFECSAHAAFTLAFAGLGWLLASRVTRQAAIDIGSRTPSGRPCDSLTGSTTNRPHRSLSANHHSSPFRRWADPSPRSGYSPLTSLVVSSRRLASSVSNSSRRGSSHSHGALIHVINERIDRQHKAGK